MKKLLFAFLFLTVYSCDSEMANPNYSYKGWVIESKNTYKYGRGKALTKYVFKIRNPKDWEMRKLYVGKHSYALYNEGDTIQ